MQTLYDRLPRPAQEAAVSAQGARIARSRYGAAFERFTREYAGRMDWPQEAVNALRDVRIAETLERASRAPYYERLFRSMGASWRDFCTPEAMRELPIIRKEDLQLRGREFEVRGAMRGDVVVSTSGTSAASLSLPTSANVDPEQWAVWWRYRNWHGITRRTPLALFASNPIVPVAETSKFWRHNLMERETRYSVYHIRPENVQNYVTQLNTEGKPWIHGNPSAIALLANMMSSLGIKLDFKPRWITCGSENLTQNYRTSIEEAFGVVPIQHYGLAEANANFSECTHGRLHVDEDYALVEFVPDEFDNLRIVGTSFSNERTAVIRYETGDICSTSAEPCSCGRWGRIVDKIDGRQGDYITLPSGVRVASLASPFHETSWLAEGQLYQRDDGHIEVRYVPRRPVGHDDMEKFEQALRRRVGGDVSVEFREFTSIPRTRRGKLRLVVSDFDPNDRGAS